MNDKLKISFSGAQSTGKTTLLNILKEKNPHIDFVPEVTRKINRECNLPINENGGDATQALIIAEHLKNFYKRRDNDVIMDRCILDGLVYTDYLFRHSKVDNWCLEFAYDTFRRIIKGYDVIFYTDPADVKLEDDGQRSTNNQFRLEIIDRFHIVIGANPDMNVITLSGTVDERLALVQDYLKIQYGLAIEV